jgi:hypothetical protein
VVLFLFGAGLLSQVDEEAGRRVARSVEAL